MGWGRSGKGEEKPWLMPLACLWQKKGRAGSWQGPRSSLLPGDGRAGGVMGTADAGGKCHITHGAVTVVCGRGRN